MRDAISGVIDFCWPEASIETACDFPEAWAAIASQPDLCISDLGMPGASPREGIERLRRISESTAILVVTGNEDDQLLLELYALGIAGFVPKTSRTAVIEAAIRVVLAGETYMPSRVLQLALGAGLSVDKPLQTIAFPNRLTDRQIEVLQLIAKGESSKEIARRLDLSPSTIKAHTAAVMTALGASNRTDAVTKALRLGIISN